MRNACLVLLTASALAACSEAEPPATATAPQALPPPKPLVQSAPAPAPAVAPVAAPQPSADEQLAARVKRALRDTRKVDGQGVDVSVAGGAVTLFGTAPSAGERRKIEEFVAGIEGVQSVLSKLVIVRGS
ncbi:MAG: BON domain-containing protein [Burkholderiales bacterium]